MSEEDKGFIKVGRNLLRAKGVMSDGKHIPLSLTEKVVLVYMDDRTNFFLSTGKVHFESQTKIGLALDLDRKTMGRVLKRLTDNSLIVATKKGRGYQYSGVDIGSITFYYEIPQADTEDFDYPFIGEVK